MKAKKLQQFSGKISKSLVMSKNLPRPEKNSQQASVIQDKCSPNTIENFCILVALEAPFAPSHHQIQFAWCLEQQNQQLR
jgi:hypothetical protein